MNVLLRSRVAGLGDRGDLVRVADGFARNYLLPRGLAIVATPKIAAQAEAMRHKAQLQREAEHARAEELARELAGIELEIAARASQEGTLFGSVSTAEIARAALEVTGVTIERDQVRLTTPIKHLGRHPVVVVLGHGVEVALTVNVVPTEH